MTSMMRLSNEALQKIYTGTYFFDESEDGYLRAFQYNKEQMAYFEEAYDFWYERSFATTSKTLEFTTQATKVSFDYKIIWRGSDDSFEAWVDGLPVEIFYVKDLENEGTLQFTLPAGNKHVEIYLTCDATVWIKNFAADQEVTPVKRGEKVLWLGDSITQGYGPLRSAHTYVSVANRMLHYDILNQGIGGYIYDKNSLQKMEGYTPDKIIVALGTNQFRDGIGAVEEYYETLMQIYGTHIPVLCISPIWRGDCPEDKVVFDDFCQKVKQVASSYENVHVVDGFTLVPHLEEYYLDNLHPNCLGTELYGRNLVAVIREIDF